jgi:hypothetical protein
MGAGLSGSDSYVVKWAVRAASTIFYITLDIWHKILFDLSIEGWARAKKSGRDGGEGWSGNVFVSRVKPPY